VPNIPGSDFIVHGIKQDSTAIDFGPFPTLNEAIQFGDDQLSSGNIVDYNISYTDVHGNNVPYEQS
jgi:hypothetical protein